LPESPQAKAVDVGVREHTGAFGDHAHVLQKRNEQGCGVFFVVNETNGKGRKSENIIRIRAVWQENDDGWKGDFPLPPSLVVSTSPGRTHTYWLVEGDWPANDRGRADFKAVMRGMAQNYGSDSCATDVSRLLRLPGFNHSKRQPVPVTLLHADRTARYTRDQLVKAFGVEDDTARANHFDDSVEGVDLPKLKPALTAIAADAPREIWIKIGMALHHAFRGNDEGFEIWDEWSQAAPERYPKKGRGELLRQWRSFKQNHANPITIASIYALAQQQGWDWEAGQHENGQHEDYIDPSKCAQPGLLTKQTMEDLVKTFRDWNNFLSPAQWQGLEDLVCHLEAMADGSADPLYYLCSLDPGIGKTEATIKFIKRLLASPMHKEVAAIVLVGRLKEIDAYIDGLKLAEVDYGVLVDDPNAVKAKGTDPKKARVLFTTQQMLESRAKRYGSFNAIKEFHYDSRPRMVRVWDETCLPARPLTISATQIEGLTDQLFRANRKLHSIVDRLLDRIKARMMENF
jgi:Primase C terminal 2 (PriCT-2)/RepB DNA-primase N-terminal domain